MSVYLCINLKDFHNNQNEKAMTNTEIRFINAKDQDDAEKKCHRWYPSTPWFVISKKYCDKHIVYADT